MAIQRLQEGRDEWLGQLRTHLTSQLSATGQSSPMWQAAVTYTISLIANGFDWAAEAVPADAQGRLVGDAYHSRAVMLAGEVNHIDDDAGDMNISMIWAVLGTWYARGVAEILEYADDLEERSRVLPYLLLNWGSFYSRLNLPPTDQ